MARTDSRIYVVADTVRPDAPRRLIRTTHPSRARSHVAADRFAVEVASQETLVELLTSGVAVEDASDEPTTPAGQAAPASSTATQPPLTIE